MLFLGCGEMKISIDENELCKDKVADYLESIAKSIRGDSVKANAMDVESFPSGCYMEEKVTGMTLTLNISNGE